MQGDFFKKFIKLQVGQILSDGIVEPGNRHLGLEYFGIAIEYAIRQIGEWFKLLKLKRRPLQVLKYPNKVELKTFTNSLSAFDPWYDQTIRKKSSLKKMKIINDFLNSWEHCHITP